MGEGEAPRTGDRCGARSVVSCQPVHAMSQAQHAMHALQAWNGGLLHLFPFLLPNFDEQTGVIVISCSGKINQTVRRFVQGSVCA